MARICHAHVPRGAIAALVAACAPLMLVAPSAIEAAGAAGARNQVESGARAPVRARKRIVRPGLTCAELASLDANHDGRLTAADTAWSGLKLWTDANSNQDPEPGEMHAVAQQLSEIGLSGGCASFTRSNGSTGTMTTHATGAKIVDLAGNGVQLGANGWTLSGTDDSLLQR